MGDGIKTAERVRHRKGGTYRVISGVGKIQTDSPLEDYAEVRVYFSEQDGSLWVRPVSEFYDGRFVPIFNESLVPKLDLSEPPPPMFFPREMDDSLKEALSTMLWTSGHVSAVLRAGGHKIPTRAEDEQAHVLHWFISLALQHGPGWKRVVGEEMQRITASLKK